MRRLARACAALVTLLAALVVTATSAPPAHAACSADPTTDAYAGSGPRGAIGFVGDSTGMGMISFGHLVDQLVAAGWGPVRASAICGGQTTINGWSALLTLSAWHAGGFDPAVVLVGLGSNDVGYCKDSREACRARIEATLAAAGDRAVVWQNISHGQPTWQAAWNAALADAAAAHPLLTVADWRAAVDADPTLVGFDQVHSSGPASSTTRARLLVQGADPWAAARRPTGPTAPAPALSAQPAAGFAPLATPLRIVDTREGRGGARLAAGETRTIDLGALAPSDVADASVAAAVNLTVDRAANAGYLTAWDCSGNRPTVSSLNYRAGAPRAAHAIVPVAARRFCVYTSWATDLVVDLAGTYAPAAPLRFVPHAPLRLLDTRELGNRAVVPAGSVTTLTIPADAVATGTLASGTITPGPGAVPRAAVLNLTGVDATRAGFVAAYPCGASVPTVSALNLDSAAPRANLVQVNLAADGTVCLYNQSAHHLVVDLAGVYVTGPGLGYQAAPPTRLLDTRNGTGGHLGAPATGQSLDLVMPPAGAAGAILTVTAVDGDRPGYVTLYPCAATPPTASNLNHGQLETVANTASVAGAACVVTQARTQVVVDASGWWVAGPSSG